MSATVRELESFHRFALEQVRCGSEKLSLAELVDLWELEHPTNSEQQDIEAALDRATAQLFAGDGMPATQFNAELRQQYGFSGP